MFVVSAEKALEPMRVRDGTKAKSLAGAIADRIRVVPVVELQCVGAGAVNQAVKAVAIARGFVTPDGLDLVAVPSFRDLTAEPGQQTGIRIMVERR